jgi:hypothetical protein
MDMFIALAEPGNLPAKNQDEKQKENTLPGQDQTLPCLAT